MDATNKRPFTFDRVTRIVITICCVILAYLLIKKLSGVLLPFCVAILIAYILEPIVKWNRRWTHCKRRFIPVVLTLLEVCLVCGAFLIFFVPYIYSETSNMAATITKYATQDIDIPYISKNIHDWVRHNIDLKTLTRYLSANEWSTIIKSALSHSWSFLSSSVAFIVAAASWLIVILYVIFIMLDYERLTLSLRQLVPMQHRRWVFKVFDDVKTAMNRYFRGQFLIAMIVGILFALGFLIIGLPMAVVLGLFIGLLNMVPYLQIASLPITAVMCLVATVSNGTDFWVIFWESMAVYVIVQCIQDLLLTPKIMGKAMGLNPAIILLSLSVWSSLLGFLGLIIALPLTTLMLSYYNRYVVEKNGLAADE